MKIYLASSWKNQKIVLELAEKLEAQGFDVDAFCRTTDQSFAFHWSEFVDSEIDNGKYTIAELIDMADKKYGHKIR